MKFCSSGLNVGTTVPPYLPINGLYFGRKLYLFPPPFWKWFSPFRDTSFFYSYHVLFAVILPIFGIILSFYFPFSLFLSPFLPFSITFYPFILSSSHIFFPYDIGWFFPLRRGGSIFQYIDLCLQSPSQWEIGNTPPPYCPISSKSFSLFVFSYCNNYRRWIILRAKGDSLPFPQIYV